MNEESTDSRRHVWILCGVLLAAGAWLYVDLLPRQRPARIPPDQTGFWVEPPRSEPPEILRGTLADGTPLADVPPIAIPKIDPEEMPPPPILDLYPHNVPQGVVPPLLLDGPAAAISDLMRRARHTGTVVARLTIDEHGRVIEVEGLSGSALFLDADQAFRRWTYEPATHHGEPIKVRWVEKMELRFDGEPKDDGAAPG